MKVDRRAGESFEVNSSLWICKTIGRGEMTSAVQWWNNLRLMRETDKWIWCRADGTYWTPADCLYNRDFYKLYKKEPLAQSDTRRQTRRKAGRQRNRPTFLPSKPGLGQMHIRSWKYCFCETVWLKRGEGWSEGEREHAGNKAREERKNGEGRTKQSQGARKGSKMGDERLPCSWCAAAEVTGGGGGGGRLRGPSHQRRLWVWPLQWRTTEFDPWHL